MIGGQKTRESSVDLFREGILTILGSETCFDM